MWKSLSCLCSCLCIMFQSRHWVMHRDSGVIETAKSRGINTMGNTGSSDEIVLLTASSILQSLESLQCTLASLGLCWTKKQDGAGFCIQQWQLEMEHQVAEGILWNLSKATPAHLTMLFIVRMSPLMFCIIYSFSYRRKFLSLKPKRLFGNSQSVMFPWGMRNLRADTTSWIIPVAHEKDQQEHFTNPFSHAFQRDHNAYLCLREAKSGHTLQQDNILVQEHFHTRSLSREKRVWLCLLASTARTFPLMALSLAALPNH